MKDETVSTLDAERTEDCVDLGTSAADIPMEPSPHEGVHEKILSELDAAMHSTHTSHQKDCCGPTAVELQQRLDLIPAPR